MAEEKHRMLYQGQDPCQMTSTSVGQQPATEAFNGASTMMVTVTEPPPYDDAIMMLPSYTNYSFTDLNTERRSSVFLERTHPCAEEQQQQQQQEVESIQLDLVDHAGDHQSHEQQQQQQQLDQQLDQQQQMTVQRVSLPYLLLGRLALPQVRNFFTFGLQAKLGDKAITIVCPACGQNGLTRLERSPNTRTHTWALWLCSFGWCCCACLCPYFMNCCRTTSHYCSNCQIYLGAYYPNSCFHQ